MSSFRDNHIHFTGSLPLDFIWKSMRRKKLPLLGYKDIWNSIFSNLSYTKCLNSQGKSEEQHLIHFRKKIKNAFTKDITKNIEAFFDIYSLFQYWTKSNDIKEREDLYINGTEQIAKSFYNERVDNFEIIAGPLIDWNETQLRINNMLNGLELFERKQRLKDFGRIRLTFISDKNNGYNNYSFGTLTKILETLEKDKKWAQRISGFDFSGAERISNLSKQKKIIEKINSFGKEISISVHAGEDLIHNAPDEFFSYFEQLLDLKIDKICHGTFLWIPDKYLNISNRSNKKRLSLLKKVSEKKIQLEICPTANVLLSPISEYNEIPVDMLSKLGISFSINTDNKSILSTDLKSEYQALNLLL